MFFIAFVVLNVFLVISKKNQKKKGKPRWICSHSPLFAKHVCATIYPKTRNSNNLKGTYLITYMSI